MTVSRFEFERIGKPVLVLRFSDWLIVAVGVLLVWQLDQLRGFSVADLLIAVLLFQKAITLSMSVRSLSLWHWAMLLLLGVHCLLMSGTALWRADWAIVNKFLGFGWLLVFYAIVADSVRRADQLVALLRRILIGSALLGIGLIGAGVAGVPVFGQQAFTAGGRLQGLSSNSGPYATYMSALMLVALALILAGIPIVRRGFTDLLLFGSFVPLIVLTGSRTGFIASCVGLVYLLIRQVRSNATGSPGFFARLLVLALPLVWVLVQIGVQVEYRNPFNRTFTVDERMSYNAEALRLWLQDPLFGSGLGTYFSQFGGYIHNTTLWVLAEFGVVGLIVVIGMFVWMFRRASFAAATQPPAADAGVPAAVRRGISAGLVAYLAASVSVELSYQRGLWFLAALGVGLWQARNPTASTRFDQWRYRQPRVRTGWPTRGAKP